MGTTVEQINASEVQVKIENVYKSFPKGNRENLVLRDINLDIKKGGVYLITWTKWLWKVYFIKNNGRSARNNKWTVIS